MDTGTVVALVLILLIAAAAVPALAVTWRRVMAHRGRLRLWQAMSRRGLAPQDVGAEDRALATAVRRCVMCSSPEECDAWLASGTREGSENFCPNATYLENLELEKKRAQR